MNLTYSLCTRRASLKSETVVTLDTELSGVYPPAVTIYVTFLNTFVGECDNLGTVLSLP